MSFFGNIGEIIESNESWTQYTERLNQFLRANDIADDGKKAAIFLSTIGLPAYHTLGNLLDPVKPFEKSFDDIVTVLKSFYSPKPSVIVQHYRFYSRFLQNEESVSIFVAELRKLAKDCEFCEALEENPVEGQAVNDH